mmetsp:Transcript_44462/g.111390  ORF Transcript_44462/g.111390 Transcript_44462/m.111390 type:complete len:109 (-) Transcript_44462:66-392(-)
MYAWSPPCARQALFRLLPREGAEGFQGTEPCLEGVRLERDCRIIACPACGFTAADKQARVAVRCSVVSKPWGMCVARESARRPCCRHGPALSRWLHHHHCQPLLFFLS